MTASRRRIGDLPNGLAQLDSVRARLAGRAPIVFLDYDGTLAPIVARPNEAVMSEGMRRAVQELAQRCRVCVVTGRDRTEIEALLRMPELAIAASHGLDLCGLPAADDLDQPDVIAPYSRLLAAAAARLEAKLAHLDGAVVERKRMSVAVHYRHVAERDQLTVRRETTRLVSEHPSRLRLQPGKLVHEILPDIEWDKGRAVLALLRAFALDRYDMVPVYLGDDATDEHAFQALGDRAVRVFVGRADDPELVTSMTVADWALRDTAEVERFLRLLVNMEGPATPAES